MDGGGLLHLENRVQAGIVKVERNQRPSLAESVMKGRQRLVDITNTANQPPRLVRPKGNQEDPNPVPLPNPKDYIAQILKENTALLRLLGERNKIVEQHELELQKLRISVQQLQQQNWHLAKANSQMLEENNLGKDRLKIIQHELGCTVAALNATKLELQVKEKLNKELCNNEVITKEHASIKCEQGAVGPLHDNEKKARKPSRKRVSRSHSLGSSAVTHEAATKDNDRKSFRRRSSNFVKTEPCELREDLFEIEDAKFPASSLLADGDNPAQLDPSCSFLDSPKEEDKDADGSEGHLTQDLRRSSIGRPLRRTTMGVSYKETSLKVKMRRQ